MSFKPEDFVERIEYHLYQDTRMMGCALTMKNGFVVHGYAACTHLVKFDPQVGMKLSREDAMRKTEEIIGFLVFEAEAADNRKLLPMIKDFITVLKENKNA
jgi:hypothetical protein